MKKRMLTDNYISKSGVQDKSRANTVKKIFSNGAVGFILVEIALAIAIVGFTLASITKMLVVASKSSEQQENVAVALNLAQARMEEIKNLAYKGDTIEKGEGSNYADSWLPDLVDVSINSYNPLIPEYLTESDYYQGTGGTAGSLSYMTPPRRIDRITQVQWVDDPEGGSSEDYKKVTVTVFWYEETQLQSVFLTTYIR